LKRKITVCGQKYREDYSGCKYCPRKEECKECEPSEKYLHIYLDKK